ncbi:hypothetical protein ABVT39_026712 [Epinephelus coioides]
MIKKVTLVIERRDTRVTGDNIASIVFGVNAHSAEIEKWLKVCRLLLSGIYRSPDWHKHTLTGIKIPRLVLDHAILLMSMQQHMSLNITSLIQPTLRPYYIHTTPASAPYDVLHRHTDPAYKPLGIDIPIDPAV